MANVTLEHIEKVYDKNVTAVSDFNLEIADKEFVVLVGPSGCGKSTTLRMVAGLEEISDGRLYIGDRLVNNVQPKDRDIAMVFQNYALYPHMTVYENMAFGLKQKKTDKRIIDEKVKEAAEILSITDLLQRKPKALSGGQRQRVAIGRAIVREPKVFLMDEPLSNLDAKLRNQMRTELIKLRKRINTTFVYVTHDQVEAMTLGDRIVIMKDGIIQQIGTPEQVYDKPANLFVASFIGSPQMNFFSADLKKGEHGYYLELATDSRQNTGQQCRLELPQQTQTILGRNQEPPQPVTVGVRPEHIILCGQAGECSDGMHKPGNGLIESHIVINEMMGNEVYVHTELQGCDVIIRVASTEYPAEYHTVEGRRQPIWFYFPDHLLHIFDRETEKSLL